jgi:V-type H+-transporting ATPase subunit a
VDYQLELSMLSPRVSTPTAMAGVVLIMIEWTVCDQSGDGTCTPWGYSCTGNDDTAAKCDYNFGGSGDGCQPPNLITTLINIALLPGSVDEPMYGNQGFVQNILLLIAFASVPVLLLAKPYFLSQKTHSPIVHHAEDEENGHNEDEEEEDDHGGFGEIVIHQAIETIEFVLGMVSNTASYLRLWALSLAPRTCHCLLGRKLCFRL